MKGARINVRLVLMMSLLAFMFLGPFYRQVIGGRSEIFPRWVMYSGAGLGVVRIELFVEDHDGERRQLDRVETGGEELFIISGRADLDALIRELMSAHRGDRALIVNARMATVRGWETIYNERRFDLNQR